VGEAGATPPSHAIIADLYPKARRAGAIAVYALGSPAGMIVAYLIGAWITEHWGWRAALFAFGLPGLIFAVILWRMLPDPPRGHSDGDAVTAVKLTEALKHLIGRPAFVHNAVASGVFAFLWFGLLSWTPSFFTRTHGMSIGEVGAWLALALGVAQLIGSWLGGVFGDRLGPRNVRWYPWICVIVMAASTPFYLIVFLWPEPRVAILVLSIPVCLSVMQGAPQHWITQAVAGPRMRATATALYLMIVNVISGFGAQTVGLLSDLFAPLYGVKSLGYALLAVCLVFSVWSTVHYWLSARTIERDIA
ncbi:MAG: MFS transporter, partial [Rhodobacteraceae bacterium]|nr:MFS transporter [Paracoccaceae bacterium]